MRAEEWNLTAAGGGASELRIGVIGFSAGGHLASLAATPADDKGGDKLDAACLIYPVISMIAPLAHELSKAMLLGPDPLPEAVAAGSSHTRVRPGMPPVFLVHTTADERVPVRHSLMFAAALAEASVPFELHVYENGMHGIGLGLGGAAYVPGETLVGALHPWTREAATFLSRHGFGAVLAEL